MAELQAQLPMLLLIMMRVAGVTTVSPVFNNRFLSAQVRVFLTFLLSILILPAGRVAPGTTEGLNFAIACLLELVVGLTIGFLSRLLFAVLEMAGAILDLDMGLSMATVMDPTYGQSQPMLGSFLHTLGLVIYFTLDGHHWLIRGLAQSYQAIPAGSLTMSSPAFSYIVLLFGDMMAAAVRMVLPFMIVMLLTTAVLGAVNRAVQQFQLFQISLGLKSVMGLVMLVVVMPYLLTFLESLFEGGHVELLKLLNMMQGQ